MKRIVFLIILLITVRCSPVRTNLTVDIRHEINKDIRDVFGEDAYVTSVDSVRTHTLQGLSPS